MKPRLYLVTLIMLSAAVALGAVTALAWEAATAVSPAATSVRAWEVQTITAVGEVSLTDATGLDFDTAGRWHIVYHNRADGRAYLASAGDLTPRLIPLQIDSTTHAEVDLAIAADDTIVVTYRDAGGSLLGRACDPELGCRNPQALPSPFLPAQEALAIDESGLSYLAYAGADTAVLGPLDSTGHLTDTIPLPGLLAAPVDLVMAPASAPNLAYLSATGGITDVGLLRPKDGGWETDNVTENTAGAGAPSGQAIALDNNANPLISYIDGAGQVQLANRPAGGPNAPWNIDLVYGGPAQGRTDVVYGGRARLAFTANGLQVAVKGVNDGWNALPIDPNGFSGVSLVLDAFGYPHVSYYSSDNKLKLASFVDRGLTLGPAEAAASAAAGEQVTYTLTLTNTGTMIDSFDVTAANQWNTAVPQPAALTLGPGDSAALEITVAVPAGAQPGEIDQTSVTVVSRARSGVSAAATLSTTVTGGTPSPTATPTATPSATSSPSPSPTPSVTLTPSATLTPAPSATPSGTPPPPTGRDTFLPLVRG